MKKWILLSFLLSFGVTSTSSFAQDDRTVAELFKACVGLNGVQGKSAPTEEGSNTCITFTCKVKTSNLAEDVKHNEANNTVPSAQGTSVQKKCISTDEYNRRVGDIFSGSSSGSGSGQNTTGSGSGQTTTGSGSGHDDGGGKEPSTGGSVYIDECSYQLNQSHPCFKKCTKWDRKLKRYVRKDTRKCLDCLAGYGIQVTDGTGQSRNSVSIGVDCSSVGYRRDANGNCVRVSSNSGTVVNSGNNGNGNGNGSVIVVQGSGNGSTSLELPEFCRSTKKKDKEACSNWMTLNARHACASSNSTANCIGHDHYNQINSRYSSDGCVNCQVGSRKDNSWIGEAISGGLHAVAGGLGAYWNSRAYERSNQAWANAAVKGFEQCNLSQQQYMSYLQANELGALSPEQYSALGCNGYSLNQYGGLGWGGMGMYNGMGYSNMFLGGMMGPYGQYNPYGMGMGMTIGSAIGGMTMAGMNMGGMMYPGIGGGMYTAGNMGGIGGIGGLQVIGGTVGYNMGGMNMGGIGGIGMNMGGMNMGGIGGIGMNMGGMNMGGIGGIGYNMGGMNMGGIGGIGYNMGGMNMGGWNGGMNGGWNGGWGSGTANYYQQAQAANYDAMLQQQGISYQMGMAGGMYGYGGNGMMGGAYTNPMNVGYQFGANFYGGM